MSQSLLPAGSLRTADRPRPAHDRRGYRSAGAFLVIAVIAVGIAAATLGASRLHGLRVPTAQQNAVGLVHASTKASSWTSTWTLLVGHAWQILPILLVIFAVVALPRSVRRRLA